MADPLEKSILDGSFFRGPRAPSPTRSASTSSQPSSSRSPSPAPPAQQHIKHSGPQTGPKGVRADRDAALAHERSQKRDELQKLNARLEKLALKAGAWEEQEKLARRQSKLTEELKDLEKRATSSNHSSDCDSDDLDSDDEAMRNYRAQRMKELKQTLPTGQTHLGPPRQIKSRHYGKLFDVDGQDYASTIDQAPAETTVVVEIASDLVQRSRRLTSSLQGLAPLYPNTKFIRVRAIDIGFGLPSKQASEDGENLASSDSEDHASASDSRLRRLEQEEGICDVLPTLLIYRNGELVHNLVRVDLEEGYEQGDEQDVERYLKALRVLGQELYPSTVTFVHGEVDGDENIDDFS